MRKVLCNLRVSINKRLDALEAIRQQINYFENNNFEKAQKSSVYSYLGMLCYWINEIEEIGGKRIGEDNRLKILKEQLKRTLKRYKALAPFDECRWGYAAVYPLSVKCYEFIERVLRKVKRIWNLLLSV